MKKLISFATAIMLYLAVFTGCGAKEVNLSEVMNKLNSDFSLSLRVLESVDDLNTYYSIDTADVKQYAAEIDANSDAPVEIVLVEAVDAQAAIRVETALIARYSDIVNRYASYSPEVFDMVLDCKVTKDNNYITMIVADNATEMLNVYYDFF